MKTAIVLILAVFAEAVGNTLLSKGMKQVAALNQLDEAFSLMMLVYAMASPMIWIGTLLLIVFLALFTASLSWADLSLVMPATAFGYVLNVIFASHFLGEPVSSARWAGTALIFLGVILVSGTGGQRTAAPEREPGRASAQP